VLAVECVVPSFASGPAAGVVNLKNPPCIFPRFIFSPPCGRVMFSRLRVA